MFDNDIRGLCTPERQALARAVQVGYIVKSLHVGYQADEAWHAHCALEGIPYVAIGNRRNRHVVIVDLDTVAHRYPSYSTVLAASPKARLQLELLVRRYKARGDYGGAYTVLAGIDASHAVEVAVGLLRVWEEGKTYGYTCSLWDVQMREQGVA